jgi:predicted alpha/beta superfamily hydrolase
MKKLLFLLLILIYQNSYCQSYKTINDTLFSNVLNESRPLIIMMPVELEPGQLLDVFYVTDAEMFQEYVVHILEFLQVNELVPPQLIVGIPNVYFSNRDRDLTPYYDAEYPKSGKADQFLSFIESELIPYINKKYPNKEKNTLLGHSEGGLFTIYTLLSRPYLFDSYIASDPSCWFADNYIHTFARENLKKHDLSGKTLFIGGRAGQQYKDMGITSLVSILKSNAPTELIWKNMEYADEHHGSVRYKDFYDGLKFTFFGQNKEELEFHPMQGILLKDEPIIVKTYSDNNAIHYTLDGTMPTRQSMQYEQIIPISSPSELTVKLFANRGADQIVKANFNYGTVPSPISSPRGIKNNTLNIKSYKVINGAMPDFKTAEIINSSIINNGDFKINVSPSNEDFAAVFSGFLQIEKDGYYTFYLAADEQAKFYIGKLMLLNYEQGKNKFGSSSFIIPLKKGFYPVKLEYLQKDGGIWISLKYHTPDMPIEKDPIKIPSYLLWGKE